MAERQLFPSRSGLSARHVKSHLLLMQSQLCVFSQGQEFLWLYGSLSARHGTRTGSVGGSGSDGAALPSPLPPASRRGGRWAGHRGVRGLPIRLLSRQTDLSRGPVRAAQAAPPRRSHLASPAVPPPRAPAAPRSPPSAPGLDFLKHFPPLCFSLASPGSATLQTPGLTVPLAGWRSGGLLGRGPA